MNVFKWFLFYYYSGIAFGGLCTAKGRELIADAFADDTEKAAEARKKMRGFIVTEAQEIGNLMATMTELSIIGSVNRDIINAYEAAKKHNEAALKLVPPAGNA